MESVANSSAVQRQSRDKSTPKTNMYVFIYVTCVFYTFNFATANRAQD